MKKSRSVVDILIFLGLLCCCVRGILMLRQEKVCTPEPAAAVTAPEQANSIYQPYLETAEPGEYTYQDLDGDGGEELLISRHGSLSEVVTIREGSALSLLTGSGLFLCEDHVIGQYAEGSGGSTYWFYQIEAQEIRDLDCLVYMLNENAWYRTPDFTGDWDTMVPITGEEYLAAAKQFTPLDSKAEEYMKILLSGTENIA